MQTSTNQKNIALKLRLANLKDELEMYGWQARDTDRYVRDALKALPIESAVALFEELAAEERAYYRHHAPLADDQLDHTLVAA